MQLNTIQIEITDKCNFQCKHCFQNKSNSILKFDEIVKILEGAKLLKTKKIVLTGGEPLLHPDFKKIIKKIRDYNFEIELYTNAFILTDDILKLLILSNVKTFHLSIDGASSFDHDWLRNKEGSFEKNLSLIRKLKKNDISIIVTCVLNKQNYRNFSKICSFFEGLKVQYKIDYLIKEGCAKNNEDICISDDEYVSNVCELIRNKVDIQKFKNKPYKKFCGIGRDFVYIDSKGYVKLCPSISADIASFGNIKYSSIDKIWEKQQQVFNSIKCCLESTCDYKNICGSGCRSRALLLNGSLESPDTIMCQVFNKLKKEEIL